VAVADRQIILPFPARITTVRRVRSTLILASINSVRRAGRFEEYERALDRAHKETLLGAVAATWLPIEAAQAHYGACDSLGVAPEQQAQAGRLTFDNARGTLLGTAVRMARSAGITPWNAMPQFQRFWERGVEGGGVCITREGPKDAAIEIVQCALFASPYFRHGLRGLAAALVELFSTRAYVTERRSTSASAVYRAQWA
jgi:hypothetical protein